MTEKSADESAPADILVKSIDSPEVLDHLWPYFSVSGDVNAVYRIIFVLDWEYIVRLRLQKWLSKTQTEIWEQPHYSDYRQMFIRCKFPIDYDEFLIDAPIDIDFHVALLAKNGELKFKELPVCFSSQDQLRLAMKSAALWSLRLFAQQNEVAAHICKEESTKPGVASRQYLSI